MLRVKRRILAGALVSAMALAQILPASAVSLDSGYCLGYGDTWMVYPTYAAGHTIRTAGNCYTSARLYTWVGTGWVEQDFDVSMSSNSYVHSSGSWPAARTLHVLRTNDGLANGVTAYSYAP